MWVGCKYFQEGFMCLVGVLGLLVRVKVRRLLFVVKGVLDGVL